MPLIPYFQNRNSKRYWLFKFLAPKTYNSVAGIIAGALSEIGLGTTSIFSAVVIGITIVAILILLPFWVSSLR